MARDECTRRSAKTSSRDRHSRTAAESASTPTTTFAHGRRERLLRHFLSQTRAVRRLDGDRRLRLRLSSRVRPPNRATGGLTPTATGFTPTPAGPGFPTNNSAGRPITTAAGFASAASAGSGCQVNNGRPPGSRGARGTITSAGRRCRRRRNSIARPAFAIGPTITTTLGPEQYAFVPANEFGAQSERRARSFRLSAMSRSSTRRRM